MKYLITFAALLAAIPGQAADTDLIVVTANRTPQPLSRIGQSISIIDQARIDQRQVNNIADILREVPGVSIARNGGLGGVTSVFIRGAESDQTVALIDGVKINDPAAPGGGFNFGNLLIGNIERIEVLRGAQSVLWGSQAIGGVVNMITAAPTDTLLVNARAEGGYRGTAQVVGNISGKAGPLSASVGGGYFRTDGISAFSEARGGKERDGFENWGANARLELALAANLALEARGYYADSRADADGFAPPSFAFGDTRDTSKTREIIGYTGLKAAFFDGRFRNRLGFALTDVRRRNYDPSSGPEPTFRANGRNERYEYQGVVDFSKGWQATFGAERENSRFDTGPGSGASARINSVYGQLVASPILGLTLTAGLRHDDHDRFGGATTFGGSGVYSPNAGATTLRASYAEGFKAPSLFQLFSDFGNTRLRPETSKGYDVGVTQKLLAGGIEASATWFHRDSVDLIDFAACPRPLSGICVNRPFGTYDNIAKARSKGVELGLLLRPIEALTLRGNYTWLDARNQSPGPRLGKRLARRPGDNLHVSADYRWNFGLETGATLTMVGASFDNASNSNRLAGYVLADLRASYQLTPAISLYARIENLFDEKYETVRQYGSFGRAAYGGVRLRL